MPIEISSMNMLVGRVVGGEQREGGEIEQRRHAEVDRRLAPDHLHHLLDHEGEAEGEQQLGTWPCRCTLRRP